LRSIKKAWRNLDVAAPERQPTNNVAPMKKTRIYVHIGGEKTGTTSLQVFLHQNAEQLKGNGIIYPNNNKRAYFDSTAHFPLAAKLADGPLDFISTSKRRTLEKAEEHLITDLKGGSQHIVVLSCEHFSSRVRDVNKLAHFRSILMQIADEVRIVFYLRDQASLSLAAFSTKILSGRRSGFNPDEINPNNAYFNHLTTLDLWSSAFGPENIIAREYDKGALVNGDICDDFCNILGVPCLGFVRASKQNESLDASTLELVRQLNQVMTSWQDDLDRYRLDNYVRNAIILPRIEKVSGNNLRLSFEERALIANRFNAVNDELNRRYMNGALSRKWFGGEDNLKWADERTAGEISSGPDLAHRLSQVTVKLARDFCVQEAQLRDAQAQLRDARAPLQEVRAQLQEAQKLLSKVRKSKASRARQFVLNWRERFKSFVRRRMP
jgi:hypothetical protein